MQLKTLNLCMIIYLGNGDSVYYELIILAMEICNNMMFTGDN